MSYTPQEAPARLFAEQAWLAGALITGAGYGIVVALFLLCFQTLWSRLKHKDVNYRQYLFFFPYVTLMFVLGSLILGSNSNFAQLAFINNRGYPGGPSEYEQQMFSIGADEISNVSYVLSNWLADSLLVWRCVIIYRHLGALAGRIIFIIMGGMQLASYILGVLFLSQISSPVSSPYIIVGQSTNWTLPYFCVSLAVNIVVTLLIVVRLLLYKRTMALLGPSHATGRTTIVAMLIESAAVYSSLSLLFLILFAMNNPISYVFIQVLGEAQLIAPLMIIYREAQGNGWISSASSTSSGIVSGDRDTRIGRFTDIQFVSNASYSQSAGTRTLELVSKQESNRQAAENPAVDEVSGLEEMELHAV